MKKCIVIGGGLAGLSAGVSLSKNNFDVSILEASPKLGGRTFSFYHPKHKEHIDNGQHIMMGCYNHTLRFLKTTDAVNKLDKQKNLKVCFVNKVGKTFELKAPAVFYPLNLLIALLRYKAITVKERIRVVRFVIKLFFTNVEKINTLTVYQWLKKNYQSDNVIKCLWEILAIGMLNTSLEKASAKTFAAVLKQVFLKGNDAATIILPGADLSKVFSANAETYITQRGGKVNKSERVLDLVINNNRIDKIITNKGCYSDFDFVVSSVPFYLLSKFNRNLVNNTRVLNFEYSPILNIHIWLDENHFDKKFYGLIDSDIHWVFNHKTHISITISNAVNLIHLNSEEIIEKMYTELEKYFSCFNRNNVVDYKIIKERKATFIPAPQIEKEREHISTSITNLFLAGDWTNTSLPATIEGAVKSGFNVAGQIIRVR